MRRIARGDGRGVARGAGNGTALRFLARPRADSRCIHAGARSPSPGTPPGIAFRRAAFARIALPSGAFRTPALRLLLLPCAALRSLVFALVPLRPLGFPLPAVRLLARFPSVAVRLRALRTGALRFSALRAGLHSPPPGRRPGPLPSGESVCPSPQAGWSLSGLLFSVLSHSGQWHAARFPHSACPFCGSRVSVCPFSGVGDYDSSRGGGQSDSGLPDSCWSRIKRTPPGIEPATFCPAVRRLNHSAMIAD